MTKFYRDYLDGKLRPERYRQIGVGLMVVVVAHLIMKNWKINLKLMVLLLRVH